MSTSRRSVMKWLGLGALAAPVVLSSRWRRAEAQAAARPKRLLLLFTPHGAPAEYFWPQSATNYSSAQASAVSILLPLQKHAARLNVLRGINYVGSNNHPAIRDTLRSVCHSNWRESD